MKCDPRDVELQTLLDLHGMTFWPSHQYWVKFEAKEIDPNHMNSSLRVSFWKIFGKPLMSLYYKR